MTDLANLLNPEVQTQKALPSPGSSAAPTPALSEARITSESPPKKQKLAKDAPIFGKAPIAGTIRFPPWEQYDSEWRAELEAWHIYPLREIAEYRRHIPYSGIRSHFLEKTGRKAFNVYQYTFRDRKKGEEWLVMWDYINGLVRITSFFKCLGYAKTAPAKVLDMNNGLREISINVTGGALAAQGYWFPFDTAKAVAATFCWDIRYALTPLFGPDFVNECTNPKDDKFSNMRIDPKIVRRATAQIAESKHEALWQQALTSAPRAADFRSGTPETATPPLVASGSATPRSVTPALTRRPECRRDHAERKGGGWQAVNISSNQGPSQNTATTQPYLPSPSASLLNEPARSAPRELLSLPSLRMLTSEALKEHDLTMDLSEDDEAVSPKTVPIKPCCWLNVRPQQWTEPQPATKQQKMAGPHSDILHRVQRGSIDKYRYREPKIDRADARRPSSSREHGGRVTRRMGEPDLSEKLVMAVADFDLDEATPEMVEAARALIKLSRGGAESRKRRRASK